MPGDIIRLGARNAWGHEMHIITTTCVCILLQLEGVVTYIEALLLDVVNGGTVPLLRQDAPNHR